MKSKNKLCGGLLTNKTIKFLYANFDKTELDNIIYSYIKSAIIFSNKKIKINNLNIATVKRKELDDFIFQKYEEISGEIIDEANISIIDFNNKKINVNNKVIKYKYLIGADGVLSFVRKSAFGKNQNMNFALETFINNDNVDLSIDFEDRFIGYNWVIPVGNMVGIGTGDVSGNTQIKDIFRKHIRDYQNTEKERGAFLPNGNDIKLTFNSHVFFAGDAAGFVSPITGEGIYYALKSAELVKVAITENKDYNILARGLIREISKHRKIKKLVFNTNIRNFVFLYASKNRLVLNFVSRMVKKYLLN